MGYFELLKKDVLRDCSDRRGKESVRALLVGVFFAPISVNSSTHTSTISLSFRSHAYFLVSPNFCGNSVSSLDQSPKRLENRFFFALSSREATTLTTWA